MKLLNSFGSGICDGILKLANGKFAVIGFGDWSGGNGSCVSRRATGPLQEIKMELIRRTDQCALLEIDEYKTSITCHCCQQPLSNMKAVTTSVNYRDGVKTVTRGRVHKVLHCLLLRCR